MDLPGRSNNDNLEDSGLAAARHKWNGEPHTLLVSASWHCGAPQ